MQLPSFHKQRIGGRNDQSNTATMTCCRRTEELYSFYWPEHDPRELCSPSPGRFDYTPVEQKSPVDQHSIGSLCTVIKCIKVNSLVNLAGLQFKVLSTFHVFPLERNGTTPLGLTSLSPPFEGETLKCAPTNGKV